MPRLINSKITTIILTLLIIWLGFSFIKIDSQKKVVSEELNNVQSKINDLRRQDAYLEKQTDYFKSSAYLEKEARLKLNYIAPGEQVAFVYKELNPKFASQSREIQNSKNSSSIFLKWRDYILNLLSKI